MDQSDKKEEFVYWGSLITQVHHIDGHLAVSDDKKSSDWNLLPKFYLVATVVSLLIIAGIIFSIFLPAITAQDFAADLVFGLSIGVSSLLILVAIVKFIATRGEHNSWNQYIEEDIEKNNGWKTKLLICGSVALAVLCIAGMVIFSAGIASFPMPAVSSVIGNMSGSWIDSALPLLSLGALSAAYIGGSTYKECCLCEPRKKNECHQPIVTSTDEGEDDTESELGGAPVMVNDITKVAEAVRSHTTSQPENQDYKPT